MKEIKELTKIGKNNGRGTSLKATVPAVIANKLNLKVKDTCCWILKEDDEGNIINLTFKKIDI